MTRAKTKLSNHGDPISILVSNLTSCFLVAGTTVMSR